jgi:hypothetical protein
MPDLELTDLVAERTIFPFSEHFPGRLQQGGLRRLEPVAALVIVCSSSFDLCPYGGAARTREARFLFRLLPGGGSCF